MYVDLIVQASTVAFTELVQDQDRTLNSVGGECICFPLISDVHLQGVCERECVYPECTSGHISCV